MKKTLEIPNPFYYLKNLSKIFRKHTHHVYTKLVVDTPMDNNTNIVTFQCKCGEVKTTRVHRESEFYKKIDNMFL